MRTQARKDLRRRSGPSGDRKGRRQVSDGTLGGRHVSGHPQFLEGVECPQGDDERQRAPTVRHSERLAVFRETEHVARMLAQLSNTDGLHVLLVAFRVAHDLPLHVELAGMDAGVQAWLRFLVLESVR
jgi:hypothetical protein